MKIGIYREQAKEQPVFERAFDLLLKHCQKRTRQAPGVEALIMKHEEQDKLYSAEERLTRLIERLEKKYQDLSDRVDCLQRSPVYIHNHISQVESTISQLRKIILGLNIGPLEIYPGELN